MRTQMSAGVRVLGADVRQRTNESLGLGSNRMGICSQIIFWLVRPRTLLMGRAHSEVRGVETRVKKAQIYEHYSRLRPPYVLRRTSPVQEGDTRRELGQTRTSDFECEQPVIAQAGPAGRHSDRRKIRTHSSRVNLTPYQINADQRSL